MKSKLWIVSVIVVLVSLFSMPVFAVDPDEGVVPGPSNASRLKAQSLKPNVFGTGNNILQIPASSFVPQTPGEWNTAYDTMAYIHPTVAGYLWTTVTLPAGANISYLDLYYYDTNETYDVNATLRGYYGGDFWGTAPGYTDFATVASSGYSGYGYAYSDETSHTVNNDVAYADGYQYTVWVYFPAVDGSLQFKGVDIWWNRQISPAPATATFSDVSTSHPFFRKSRHWQALAYQRGMRMARLDLTVMSPERLWPHSSHGRSDCTGTIKKV